jgi:hypothetical protein
MRNRPPVVEGDIHPIQSDRPAILHHEGDLLTQDAAARHDRFSPAQEVILRFHPDRTRSTRRWIEAKPAAIWLSPRTSWGVGDVVAITLAPSGRLSHKSRRSVLLRDADSNEAF